MLPETIDISNKHNRHQFTAYVGDIFSDMGLLGEYENAINIIIKDLKSTKSRIDVVAHPVLYMMRHSMELGYKCNFGYLEKYSNRQTGNNLIKSHDLSKLHTELKEHFISTSALLGFDNEIVYEFNKYFDLTTTLINKLGPTEASSFRYTKNARGRRIFQTGDTIDIGEVKEYYDKAVVMLTHTVDLISPYTDYKDLMEKVPSFNIGTGIALMTFPSFQLKGISEELDEKYEKLDQLKWRDKNAEQTLLILTVENLCYLVPIKND